jgi:hypothetical protein
VLEAATTVESKGVMDVVIDEDTDEVLRERAVKHLKKRRDFYGHVMVYVLVNAFLVVIWP